MKRDHRSTLKAHAQLLRPSIPFRDFPDANAARAAAALEIAKGRVFGIEAVPARMARSLEADGVAFAEARSFALAKQMPRPDAQTVVKTLCRQAVESDQPLPIVAQAAHPDLAASLFDPTQQWGDAPAAARAFVRDGRVRGLEPLQGTGPHGDVRADTYEILDEGDRVVLRGNVDMTIYPDGREPSLSPDPME